LWENFTPQFGLGEVKAKRVTKHAHALLKVCVCVGGWVGGLGFKTTMHNNGYNVNLKTYCTRNIQIFHLKDVQRQTGVAKCNPEVLKLQRFWKRARAQLECAHAHLKACTCLTQG